MNPLEEALVDIEELTDQEDSDLVNKIRRVAAHALELNKTRVISDMTRRGRTGTQIERERYYYVPLPTGGVYREQAVIACTIRGAVGPFTMKRTITYGAWELDPEDNRRDQ